MRETLAFLSAFSIGLSGIFLLAGVIAIKKKKRVLHQYLMLSAVGFTVLFLVLYLTRFFLYSVTPYKGAYPLLYKGILLSHSLLAAINAFLVIRVLYFAWKKNFSRHKKWASFTLYIWFYVIITGWIIYYMLYL